MNSSEPQNRSSRDKPIFAPNYLNLGVFVLGVALVFIVAISSVAFALKISVLLFLIFGYALYVWRAQSTLGNLPSEIEEPLQVFDENIESKLIALDEASDFFSASLKGEDMFRLVAARINEMIPFTAAALFLGNSENSNLKIGFATGSQSAYLLNTEIQTSAGLAGKTFTTGSCQIDNNNLLDKELFSETFLDSFDSSIASPLFRESHVFGVLQLFGDKGQQYGESSKKLFDAISERFSPLMLSSIAFENNLSSALTDSLTNLPNERAFFMVLENQIAESQRHRDDRALSVLSLDIKNFAEINQKFGHSTGDRLLAFTADVIKNQLRGMDFLARSSSDEFLAVLPTASEEISREITERLQTTLESNPFQLNSNDRILIQLNYGFATFWQDGETGHELLKIASIRKQQNKSLGNVKIIQFPSNR